MAEKKGTSASKSAKHDHDKNVRRKNAYSIPPEEIVVPDGFNLRIDYGDIPKLAENIRKHGLITPLVLIRRDDGRYELRDGFRRMEAIKLNAEKYDFVMKRVEFNLEPARSTKVSQIANIFRRNDGKNLNFYEMAEGCKRLHNEGLSNKEIAEEIGRSESEVSNLMMVATKTEPKVLKIIADNIEHFSENKSKIFEILRNDDPDEQIVALKNALNSMKESGATRVTGDMIDKSRQKATGIRTVSPMKKLKDFAVKGREVYGKNQKFLLLLEVINVLNKEKSFEELCESFGFDANLINND